MRENIYDKFDYYFPRKRSKNLVESQTGDRESSGFQSWQQERNLNTEVDLDKQVRRYLRETLETLAY